VIAVDTSALIAFLQGARGEDMDRLAEALTSRQAVLPPPVLTEALSNAETRESVWLELTKFDRLFLDEAAWERAAQTRGLLLAKKRRARLADTLIAQACIDADVPLLTRDRDFNAFAELAGLKLA